MAESSNEYGRPTIERPSSSLVRIDPFVGNVYKIIPLPKDYSGPTKKGHLQFDAAFENGTLRLSKDYNICCSLLLHVIGVFLQVT